jgi:hypothetical protein
VFSFRYDAHLVPALLANIDPLTDGWVAYDDSGGEGLISNEVRRRTALLQAARDAGARWALAIDPDERFEAGLAAEIGRLTEPDDCSHAYTFAVREMYSPDHYRVDGMWGRKRQARLLSLANGVTTPAGELHLSWASSIPDAQVRDTHFNLYHLKMITPDRRKARAALYEHLDPDHRMQAMGYTYLADDAGAELEPIADGRGYHPPHQEDGGLWMPRVGTLNCNLP